MIIARSIRIGTVTIPKDLRTRIEYEYAAWFDDMVSGLMGRSRAALARVRGEATT